MGASGKMDAEIPPDAGEQCLRLKLRPAVRVLALYSVVGVTAVANSSSLCTRNDHIGEPEQFNVFIWTVESEKNLSESANVHQKA
jgi:hypothetical protein